MKYDRLERNTYNQNPNDGESLDLILAKDEKVLWRGKPKKSVFILENITTMMPIALIWFAFDGFFIATMMRTEVPSEMTLFFVFFFALHLMPVWMWLSKVITARRRYENMEYCVTDKRIIIKSGFIGANYVNIMYKDVHSVNVHVGILDKMFGVGDVMIDTGYHGKSSKSSLNNSIIDVENPYEVMQLIQKTVIDMQSDINYPNALRPKVNEGYKTVYKPDDDIFSSGSN